MIVSIVISALQTWELDKYCQIKLFWITAPILAWKGRYCIFSQGSANENGPLWIGLQTPALEAGNWQQLCAHCLGIDHLKSTTQTSPSWCPQLADSDLDLESNLIWTYLSQMPTSWPGSKHCSAESDDSEVETVEFRGLFPSTEASKDWSSSLLFIRGIQEN